MSPWGVIDGLLGMIGALQERLAKVEAVAHTHVHGAASSKPGPVRLVDTTSPGARGHLWQNVSME